MGKTKLVRIDTKLEDVFKEMQKQGKVKSFPEFSRLIADDFKIKKNELRFFK